MQLLENCKLNAELAFTFFRWDRVPCLRRRHYHFLHLQSYTHLLVWRVEQRRPDTPGKRQARASLSE